MRNSRPLTVLTAAVATLALLAGGMLGCSPQPEPSPTPTAAFASEEEAFAAAEEVYRAYTHALNAERAGDTSTNSLDYLTGLALEDHLDSQEELDSNGIRVIGNTSVASFAPIDSELDSVPYSLTGMVCIDISGTSVIDEHDEDVTPLSRARTAMLEVGFTGSAAQLLISTSDLAETSC
ncbi:hypothetical protein [Microbacterium tumbae]